MSGALWEPWEPHVGDDEVEVWLSAECVCPYCGNHAHGDLWDSKVGYRGIVRGIHRADIVACRTCSLPIPGHFYLVAARHLEEYPRRAYGWTAAIEMRKVNH